MQLVARGGAWPRCAPGLDPQRGPDLVAEPQHREAVPQWSGGVRPPPVAASAASHDAPGKHGLVSCAISARGAPEPRRLGLVAVVRLRPRALGVGERAVLTLVQREPWEGTVGDLARHLKRSERAVWLVLAALLDRGAVTTRRNDSTVRVAITRQGRAMMVRNPPGGNPRRTVKNTPA